MTLVPIESAYVGSRALSFKRPLLSLRVKLCVCACLYVRDFEVKYLENQGNKRVGYYWEPIRKWPGAMNGDVADDVRDPMTS